MTNDSISRQAAIDALYKMLHDCFWVDDEELDAVITTLNELPSAQRKGKWIRENIVLTSNPPQYQWHCSECGRLVHWFSTEMLTEFCPNCGAWMKGEEDGQLNIKTGCD